MGKVCRSTGHCHEFRWSVFHTVGLYKNSDLDVAIVREPVLVECDFSRPSLAIVVPETQLRSFLLSLDVIVFSCNCCSRNSTLKHLVGFGCHCLLLQLLFPKLNLEASCWVWMSLSSLAIVVPETQLRSFLLSLDVIVFSCNCCSRNSTLKHLVGFGCHCLLLQLLFPKLNLEASC